MKHTHVRKDDVVDSLSGALSGALTAIAVCPLDVLRTRFQVQSNQKKYNSLASGIRLIVREEGVRGLYCGLSPTLIALVPNWAIYFSVYEHLKHSWLPVYRERNASFVHLFSAIGAGVSTVVITNPLWVVKTRLQTQGMGLQTRWTQYRGTMDGLTKIIQQEGLSRLYAGLVPSLIGVAHVAIQFPLYEYLKTKLSQFSHEQRDQLSIDRLILASSLAKMVASTLTYPHEVIRSRMHLNGTKPFHGFGELLKVIWREEGFRSFYSGCGINLCRTVPSAAITFTSYELIARFLRNIL